jgi:hypothetical protein
VERSFDPTLLMRHWVHSHEEDTDTTEVYRPEDYDFPPSRGRKGLALEVGGNLTGIGIGPTDRAEHVQGSWRLEGENRLEVSAQTGDQPPRVLLIESLDNEKLVVRKGPTRCSSTGPDVS